MKFQFITWNEWYLNNMLVQSRIGFCEFLRSPVDTKSMVIQILLEGEGLWTLFQQLCYGSILGFGCLRCSNFYALSKSLVFLACIIARRIILIRSSPNNYSLELLLLLLIPKFLYFPPHIHSPQSVDINFCSVNFCPNIIEQVENSAIQSISLLSRINR